MYTHQTQVRVRYGETDQMGYLYYGNYALYYEVGRAEMLRSLGHTYREMEEKYQVLMPVMSLNMRFVRPAHYDDLLTIKTTVRKLPQDNITFHMEIFNDQQELVNGGSVRLGFIAADTYETVSAPSFLIDCLSPHFE